MPMKKAFLYALGFHLIFMIFMVCDIRLLPRKEMNSAKPLVIDYVVISKETAAPKKSNNKIVDKKDKKKIEEKKKVEDTAAQESVENAQRNEEKKQEDNKSKPVKKTKPKPKKDKPKKKPQNTKKKKEKSKPSKKKAEKNIKKQKSGKKKDSKKQKASLDDVFEKIEQDQDSSADTPNLAPVLTISDIDALRQKIAKCWVVPAGAENARDMVVDIDMKIAKDGRVIKANIVDKGRMKKDGLFRIAAENAQRAVLDPDCNPLPLPLSKYEQWKDLTMSFNPKDMFE